MKGLGVFSPSYATSRYLMVASGLYEASGNGTPRMDTAPVTLNLVDFKISEKPERASDPFSNNFDNPTNFNQYATDAPFSFSGGNFGDYMSTQYNTGIAEFSLLHSTPFNLPNGHLSTMKWLKLGPPYEEDRTLLAVGNNLGDVFFYDSDLFVANKALVTTYSSNVCMVPVKCFGYCGKNMLGVAGLDGQVSVVDLGDHSNYHVVDVSYGKWKVGLVTSLSWNYRLSHILASSGSALVPSDTSGVVVWDLKVRKPASTFRDPNGRVNPIALDWVPDQPTQLVVGYADDNSPALQLWDLRNCSAPLTDVRAHTRGLTDLKFSPHDPNVLLTSAKDDTTKCWHLKPERTFNLVSSLQTEALSHHSRVEWHPNAPGLFLSQANDGNLCVHHMFSGNVESSYMPLWSRKKADIIVGFGGQVVTWTNTDVRNYTLSTRYDPQTAELLDNTLEVLSVLHDESMFVEFCESRASLSTNELDRLTWSVLKSQYRGELRDLLDVLGYPDRSEHSSEDRAYSAPRDPHLMDPPDLLNLNNNLVSTATNNTYYSNRTRTLSQDTTQTEDDKEAEDFFNSLTLNTQNLLDVNHPVANPDSYGSRSSLDGHTRSDYAPVSDVADDERLEWSPDSQLKYRLVKADYLEAANRCMDLNKVVEALLLGYVAGQDAFLDLVERVVRSRRDPFLNLVHLVMQNDLERVLTNSTLSDWKDTLCLLYRYSDDTEYFRDLVLRFGKRLQQAGHFQEASICFILAAEYNEVAALWKLTSSRCNTPASHVSLHSTHPLTTPHSARSAGSAGSRSGRLEDRMEMLLKLSVLAFSTSHPRSGYSDEVNASFDAVLVELSEVFVDAGQLHKALETLNVRGASNSEMMVQLKSKIQNQIDQLESEPQTTAAPSVDSYSHPHTAPAYATPAAATHAAPVVGGYTAPAAAPAHYNQPVSSYTPVPAPVQHQPAARPSYQPAAPTYQQSQTPVYQPTVTATPAAALPQTMPSTATRTVPMTALQTAPTQTSSMVSALTSSTAAPSSLATSHFPSNATQFGSQTTNFTPYTSLSHTNSNSSYGAPHAAPSYPAHQAATMTHPTTVPATHPVPTTAPVYAAPPTQSFNAVSSAPGAVAGALNPGMPIPWPNPTATQQLSSKTVSTQQSNKLIIESAQPAPKGEKMVKGDLDMVVSTLHSLVANLGDSRMDQDNRKNVNDLVNSLNQGMLSAEANSLLATLCRAVSNGDHFNSNVILNNIVSKLWNNQNKPWIMCLKRLVPK